MIHPTEAHRAEVRGLRMAAACAGFLIALGVAAPVSARQPPPPEPVASPPHDVVVTIERRSLAVHFSPGAEAPDPAQITALNVLLATGDLGRGDVVRIERPPGPLAQARADMLSTGLTREGLSTSTVISPSTPADELSLRLEHAVASAPGCPDWSKAPGNDFDNTLHSDFGCTTATDLAAMIADPRDLLVGHVMGPAVGDNALAAMHKYQTGKSSIGEGSMGSAPGPASSANITVTPAGGTAQ
jgi:pilus assembly protein CpaD